MSDAKADAMTKLNEICAKLDVLAGAVAALRSAPHAAPSRPAAGASGCVVPFGTSKGKPIEGESDKSLLWIINYAREAVGNPDKARFAESNQALLAACLAEGRKRGIVDDMPPPHVDSDAPVQEDVPF